MLKIYRYDIWNMDKGIIFAENREQACEIFKRVYDNPIYPEDIDDYDHGVCSIDYACDIESEPRLVYMEG